MKEGSNFLTSIGLLIYAIATIVDKFIIEIVDYIYITLLIIAIIFILLGFFKRKKIFN